MSYVNFCHSPQNCRGNCNTLSKTNKNKTEKKTTQTFRKLRTILILWKLILRVIFIHKSSAVVVKYGEVVLSQNKLIRVSAENADALNKKKKIRPQKTRFAR